MLPPTVWRSLRATPKLPNLLSTYIPTFFWPLDLQCFLCSTYLLSTTWYIYYFCGRYSIYFVVRILWSYIHYKYTYCAWAAGTSNVYLEVFFFARSAFTSLDWMVTCHRTRSNIRCIGMKRIRCSHMSCNSPHHKIFLKKFEKVHFW